MSYKFYTGDLPHEMTQDSLSKLTYIHSMNGISYFDGEGEFEKVYTSKMFSNLLDQIETRMEYLRKYETSEELQENAETFDYNLVQEGMIKYLGFSGHDSNIYPILFALNTNSLKCLESKFRNLFSPAPTPEDDNLFLNGKNYCFLSSPFASNIEILLLRNTDSKHFYLQLLFNGEALPICINSQSPTHPCPVSVAVEYLKSKMVA
jgi:hypothetical protein